MAQSSVLPNSDLPNSDSSPETTPPDGAVLRLDLGLILRDEKLPGSAYWHGVIKGGNTLRITDLEGSQGVSLICYNADNPIERLNVADTAKIQFNAFLKKGMVIYSDMGRVLFSITEDTSGYHDLFGGCSNAASNAAKYGEGDFWVNARDSFRRAVTRYGLSKRDIPPNLNLFTRVAIEPDGKMTLVQGAEKPGSFIDLRAEMNVLVVLSNCPHPLHPSTVYEPKAIQVTVWNSPAPAADDLCRTANPEAERGFVNTDALFAQD
ncbi:urea amidolyase associated protein UAAP1 [Leptolyngbya sp. FACHB-711]|uniref:urea amidolyase associated protein UAAP1 n=1 Tax=Leptolyngbya sp. FACHB-711 TaxID=2692813 RepID=UPI001684CF17|nr:urea amidolyase associated protein UAAP1 [Leptolyngbya sp. FACHB-711]MBD1852578.1 urea carboxylase-associated family protein [Cyanobacteria bacterium FACHB-502]MBD2024942.1 urea carboxylase-associated family protein [Leptolyngbya sp. FACHB-711]